MGWQGGSENERGHTPSTQVEPAKEGNGGLSCPYDHFEFSAADQLLQEQSLPGFDVPVSVEPD